MDEVAVRLPLSMLEVPLGALVDSPPLVGTIFPLVEDGESAIMGLEKSGISIESFKFHLGKDKAPCLRIFSFHAIQFFKGNRDIFVGFFKTRFEFEEFFIHFPRRNGEGMGFDSVMNHPIKIVRSIQRNRGEGAVGDLFEAKTTRGCVDKGEVGVMFCKGANGGTFHHPLDEGFDGASIDIGPIEEFF